MFVRLLLLKNHYQIIAVDLGKPKELDADSRASVYSFRKITRNDTGILQRNSKVL